MHLFCMNLLILVDLNLNMLQFYSIKFTPKSNESKDRKISWGRKSSAHKAPLIKKKSTHGIGKK